MSENVGEPVHDAKAVGERNQDGDAVGERNQDGDTVGERNQDGDTVGERNQDGDAVGKSVYDAGDERCRGDEHEHLRDLEAGAGCTEIWEHLSEHREEE